MDFPCPPPLLAAALLLVTSAAPVAAQTFRPDAEGYPCSQNARLAVIERDGNFSIQTKIEQPAQRAAAPVAVGDSLLLDRRLFQPISPLQLEQRHVAQH